MSKRFFIWKDEYCNGNNPEQVEISFSEFMKIKTDNKSLPDNKKRWFYKLPGIESGDDYLIMECSYEKYLESQAVANSNLRSRKIKEEFDVNYSICSLDFTYIDESGEEYTLHDIVADSKVNVEEITINNQLISELYHAISFLDEEDKEFILNWINLKSNGKSNSEIADLIGLTRRKLEYKFSCIVSELKNFF